MGKLKLISRKDEILSMYENGYSIQKIAETIKEYPQAVSNLVKYYTGIKTFLPDKGNTHYFDTIDNTSKAYILGFIAADGSLVKSNATSTLTITIKYEDKEILDFVKSEIGNSHKLLEILKPAKYNPSKMIHHIRYYITDKNIETALLKYGIHPNKSLSMKNIINNIPIEFRDAFIIGYFDGDGSVSINNQLHAKFIKTDNVYKIFPCYNLSINIRGTEEFLSGIASHLNISNNRIHKYDSIATLAFSKKSDVIRFYNCYKGMKFFLKRKHDVFISRINHPSYDKYKQD